MGVAAVPVAMMVVSAAASAAAARQKDQAVKRSMRSAERAAEVQRKQISDAEAIELRKRQNEAAMIRGRLRVTGAEAGVGDGIVSLFRQSEIDDQWGQEIIRLNAENERQRVATGLQANLDNLAANGQNALLAGLMGGLGGYQTGLQIESMQTELNRKPATA